MCSDDVASRSKTKQNVMHYIMWFVKTLICPVPICNIDKSLCFGRASICVNGVYGNICELHHYVIVTVMIAYLSR